MTEPAKEESVRRPQVWRQVGWIHQLARLLQHRGVRPNHVSIASVVISLLGGAALIATPYANNFTTIVLFLCAPAMIALRGLCNLIDGLIAVEGGLKTRSGEVFNDLPDRLSDVLLFVGAGYAALTPPWAPALGWAAACGALLTAYVRCLGGAVGAWQSFAGPMAKPMRMAVLTAACIGCAIETPLRGTTWCMTVGLIIVVAGCLVTAARRARQTVKALEAS